MPVSDQDQVRVLPFLHLSPVDAVPSAALYVQLRPQAMMARPQATEAGRRFLADLRAAGWADPTRSLADGRVSALPMVGSIAGFAEEGPLVVTSKDVLLYDGNPGRPEGWTAAAAEAGWVLVMIGADPTLDHKGPQAGAGEDLVTENSAAATDTMRVLGSRRLLVGARCTTPVPRDDEDDD